MKSFDMFKTPKSGINLAYLRGQKLKETQYTEGTERLEHEKKEPCSITSFLPVVFLPSSGEQSMCRLRPFPDISVSRTKRSLLG